MRVGALFPRAIENPRRDGGQSTAADILDLLEEEDPRLQNAMHCVQCGACTPFCPAALDDANDPGGGYLPRMITAPIRSGAPTTAPIDACVQCYTCHTICQRGVSVGGIVNALYERRGEGGRIGRLLASDGMLPPRAFLPFYTRGLDVCNYIWNRWRHQRRIEPESIRDQRRLLALRQPARLLPGVREQEPQRGADVENVFLLQSCCNFNFPGIPSSGRYLLDVLGIEHTESQEQTCCGGAPYFLGELGYAQKTLLSARNLAVIEDSLEHPAAIQIATLCPTCFESYIDLKATLSVPANLSWIEGHLDGVGYRLDGNVSLDIMHIVEVIKRRRDVLRKSIAVPLCGLTVNVHSSCHYKKVRGSNAGVSALTDLVRLTGAKVGASTLQPYCCGGIKNMFDRYSRGERDSPSLLNREKVDDFERSRADAMVVDCPGCQLVFDQLGIPVIHIAQLIGLATGSHPRRGCGLHHHLSPVEQILDKVDRG